MLRVGPPQGGPPAGANACPSRGELAGPGGSARLPHAPSGDRTRRPRTASLLGAPPGRGRDPIILAAMTLNLNPALFVFRNRVNR